MAKEAMTLKRLFNAGMINEQSDIQLMRMCIEKDPIDGAEVINSVPVDAKGKFWEPHINTYWETPIVVYTWYNNGGDVWVKLEPEIVYTDNIQYYDDDLDGDVAELYPADKILEFYGRMERK